MLPVVKLSKDEMPKCMAWLKSVQEWEGPLPREFRTSVSMHDLLWRFAIMHRREAGKLRVMNNGLYWKHVPVRMPEVPLANLGWGRPAVPEISEEQVLLAGSKTAVEKLLAKKASERIAEEPGKQPVLTPEAVTDFVGEHLGTCPQVKRPRFAITASACGMDLGRIVFELHEGEPGLMIKLLNLGVFPKSVSVNLVDMP